MDELLSLKWNNHNTILLNRINLLRTKGLYSDVTLLCEGNFYNVHRFILSSCSTYFEEIFKNVTNSNLVIMVNEILPQHLEYLLDYMYCGEIKVGQQELEGLIKAAEYLKVKGLAADDIDDLETIQRKPTKNDKLVKHDKLIKHDKLVKHDNPKKVKEVNHHHSDDSSPESKKQKTAGNVCDIDVDTFMSVELLENSLSKDTHCIKNEEYDNHIEAIKHEIFNDSGSCDPSELCSSDLINSSDDLEDHYQGQFMNDEYKITSQLEAKAVMAGVELQTDEFSLAKKIKINRDQRTCHLCSKEFAFYSALRRHMYLHTGEKPFSCPHCMYKCNRKDHLRTHIVSKHLCQGSPNFYENRPLHGILDQ